MSGLPAEIWRARFYGAYFGLMHRGIKAVNPADTLIARHPWLYKIVGYRLTLWYDLQDPLYCASREITEETGLTANKIECMGSMAATPGYCSEIISLFIGTELSEDKANPDENEYVSTVKMPLKEAVEMADKGLINDAKTLVLLYKASRRFGI